jgi:xanthine phosphoribosyltransferase
MGKEKRCLKYSWKELEKDCRQISNEIYGLNVRFGCIVAITTGGLIPAGIIAKNLGIKEVYTIGYSSYKNRKQERLINTTPLWDYLMYRNVIIIDDIVDTGRTMLKAKENVEGRNNSVLTVALHYKLSSIFTPHIFVHKTKQWIKYPWEKYEKN